MAILVRHDMLLTSAAEFSPCERYRYTLRRSNGNVLERAVKPLVFLMLNPSTADALKDDPTVAKCRKWAQAWGYSDLIVLNMFALRSTDPNALLTADDPIGPANDETLEGVPRGVMVIAAWGNHKATRSRWRKVVGLLDRPLMCLGVNQDNSPRHPLYLKNTTCPQPWSPPA